MAAFNSDSMNQSSIGVGHKSKYFSTMKIQNNEKFCYIKAIGNGNLVTGYHKYREARISVVDEFLELYAILEDIRAVSAFTRDCKYVPFSIAKLGTRVLKHDLAFKTFRHLEIMNPKIDDFIKSYRKE